MEQRAGERGRVNDAGSTGCVQVTHLLKQPVAIDGLPVDTLHQAGESELFR